LRRPDSGCALIDEKRIFLEDKLARDMRLFFTHDPKYCSASVVRDERGRYSAGEPRSSMAGAPLN
jgi:hypothetical protein